MSAVGPGAEDAGSREVGVPAHTLFKRLLIGRPLATQDAVTQRLRKLVALPVFSSDAISSTGYGTEVILGVLVPVAGMAALSYIVPISLVVMVVLVILVVSYRQTIFAYPSGGGSYIVSRENLGRTPSLVAGASLLVDYTLNVAVSIAAGTAAITSAIVPLRGHEVILGLALLVLVTVANLRGLRESATLFSVPVYIYVAMMGVLIVVGLVRVAFGGLHPLPVDHAQLAHFTNGATVFGGVTIFLFLKAFSSGAVALSGVEAISNGVPNFRPPESRNAATTLMWTGILLGRRRPARHSAQADPVHRADDPVNHGGGGVRRPQQPPVRDPPGQHRGDPVPFGQHQLRRLPAALVDHRPGRVPSPPIGPAG
jgi:hypothetical protein